MHEFIDGPDDVVALGVSGKLTSADLSAMMDRLEQPMASHEVVHVFVEVRSLDAVELSGFGVYRDSHGKHTPHLLAEALSWHQRYLDTGSMRA